MPESADSRPRLGDLLLSAGLITQEQLDESLTLARTAGKPLGHVLVEQGLVPAHSIAMALADQHGGPLKTEFGFATGRSSTPRTPDVPGKAPSTPSVLRLAPAESGASEAASNPAAPVLREARVQPIADVVQLEAETAARLSAEARADELLARVAELQAELEAARKQLATALAADAAFRSQLVAEREAREQDTKTVEAWRAQLEEARAANEQAAEAAKGLRAQLQALRARDEATPDALRARVVELEAAVREAQPPVVVPLHGDVDELRAVIELQEQALAAAAARERARDGDARVVVDASSTRSYSNDLHFLFAPSTDGYELLERSGPSPSPGEVVELSGGRTCRVTRVGPAPFPGATEACAYLELV